MQSASYYSLLSTWHGLIYHHHITYTLKRIKHMSILGMCLNSDQKRLISRGHRWYKWSYVFLTPTHWYVVDFWNKNHGFKHNHNEIYQLSHQPAIDVMATWNDFEVIHKHVNKSAAISPNDMHKLHDTEALYTTSWAVNWMHYHTIQHKSNMMVICIVHILAFLKLNIISKIVNIVFV